MRMRRLIVDVAGGRRGLVPGLRWGRRRRGVLEALRRRAVRGRALGARPLQWGSMGRAGREFHMYQDLRVNSPNLNHLYIVR